MEDSSEVQCEENKEILEKNKKRRFKTPYQLQALEDFYNEHKYPTESMKAELAENIGLTEKQISGWFCHRRLKDKRIRNGESNTHGRQDLSSGVIQDRGSGLKQDSCSSTKQCDYRLADLREVESRRFGHNDLPAAEICYEQRVLDDRTEMDGTSSESNSALQGSFYPHKRSPLDVQTTEYRAPNGLIAQNRRRVGPSGYLKIKGQTENAAITAVKRQLGRQYREDGPPLGIDFDPLPPEAFESPRKNANTDAYGVSEPVGSSSLDIGAINKRPSLSTIRNQEKYVAPSDYGCLHKSDTRSFPYRQPKQKSPFPNHDCVYPAQKSSFSVASYSAKETSDYDGIMNNSILKNQEPSCIGSDSYSGKFTGEPEEPWHTYGNGNPMAVRRRERLDSRSAAVPVRYKVSKDEENRVLPRRMMKDAELYAERRHTVEHYDSTRLKMRLTNELRAGKRGREELLQEDYAAIKLSQEPSQWSRRRGSTELPSSFSEDETAETSSSME